MYVSCMQMGHKFACKMKDVLFHLRLLGFFNPWFILRLTWICYVEGDALWGFWVERLVSNNRSLFCWPFFWSREERIGICKPHQHWLGTMGFHNCIHRCFLSNLWILLVADICESCLTGTTNWKHTSWKCWTNETFQTLCLCFATSLLELPWPKMAENTWWKMTQLCSGSTKWCPKYHVTPFCLFIELEPFEPCKIVGGLL